MSVIYLGKNKYGVHKYSIRVSVRVKGEAQPKKKIKVFVGPLEKARQEEIIIKRDLEKAVQHYTKLKASTTPTDTPHPFAINLYSKTFTNYAKLYKDFSGRNINPYIHQRLVTLAGNLPLNDFFEHQFGHRISRFRKFKSASYANKLIRLAKAIFRWCIQYNHLNKDFLPTIGIYTEKERQRWIKPDEFDAIYQHLPNWSQPIIKCLYLSGARAGELRNLTTQNVDLKNRSMTLTTRKTKDHGPETRKVPIPSELLPYFKSVKQGFIFTCQPAKREKLVEYSYTPQKGSRKGKEVKVSYRAKARPISMSNRKFRNGYITKRTLSQAFWRACKEAKIHDPEGTHIHDLRGTCASNLTQKNVNKVLIMQLLGHKTDSMFIRYQREQRFDSLKGIVP